MSSMPITVGADNLSIVVNPLDPAELFVDPGSLCVDLPRLRQFLPAEWRDAPVHRFERQGYGGSWVLRQDVPAEHLIRVWGSDDHWGCECTACEAYRAVRLDLVLPVAVDSLLADALQEG